MKDWKRFLVAVGAGAAVFLVFRAVLVSPTRDDVGRERDGIKNLRAERESYFRKRGAPIADVKKSLEDEKRKLEDLKRSVGRLELAIPPELEPDTLEHDKERGVLYFQQRLAELRSRARGSPIKFANQRAPLGFGRQVPYDRVAEFLARLAVAGRFLDAAEAAGLSAVLGAEHPAAQAGRMDPMEGLPVPGGGREVEELPFRVVAVADERSLTRLLQELSRPKRFLALKKITIQVKDASSGSFETTLDLAGIRTVSAPPGPAGPDEGEDPTTGELGPGRSVPVKAMRRRF